MYDRDDDLLGIALPTAGSFITSVFSPSTEDKNPERIAKNAELEQRALAGDNAAFSQLQQRAIPGVLPYIVATNDAKARVANVQAARSGLPSTPYVATAATSPAGTPTSTPTATGLFSSPLVLGGLALAAVMMLQGGGKRRRRR